MPALGGSSSRFSSARTVSLPLRRRSAAIMREAGDSSAPRAVVAQPLDIDTALARENGANEQLEQGVAPVVALESGKSEDRIRVIVVGTFILFREAIASVLAREPDFTVVGSAATSEEVPDLTRGSPSDVVLLDLFSWKAENVRLIQTVKRYAPQSRILVMAERDDPVMLLEALGAGADGFVSRTRGVRELLAATRAVARGEVVVPRRMVGPLLSRVLPGRLEDDKLRRVLQLTPRERQILGMVSRGKDNAAIGRALFISPKTVRTHVQRILNKLGVHSRLEAAAFIEQSGAAHVLTWNAP